MILVSNLTKTFETHEALSAVGLSVSSGCVYGLVGTNGAGKSTLLRTVSGIYAPKSGAVTLDGKEIFDNPECKSKIVLVPDDLYFPTGASIKEMADLYRRSYPSWNQEKFEKLCTTFPLGINKKINTFSKGMKRQAAIILALAREPDYLLLDEAFDGLDPVIRVAVRKLIYDEVAARNMSVLISSHNLRELEDICDHIVILHAGRMLLEREMDDLKTSYCKVQMAFNPMPAEFDLGDLNILSKEVQGSIVQLLVKGDEASTVERLQALNPLVLDCVSLTLEEVFISEMEAIGYDYNHIIF